MNDPQGRSVYVLQNPIKVITVEGKFTSKITILSVDHCLENANIYSGNWNVGINCVKVHCENINSPICHSVNISTNIVKGYEHTRSGIHNHSPTIGSFYLKIGGPTLTDHHAFHDLSPIKWFPLTNPSNTITLKINFWPEYELIKQLQQNGDTDDFILNFQIDMHLYRLQ